MLPKPRLADPEPLPALVRRAQAGDTTARDLLFEQCAPSLLRAFHRQAPPGWEVADYLGEAFLLFDRLLREYQPARGVPFAGCVRTLAPSSVRTRIRTLRRHEECLVWGPDADAAQEACPAPTLPVSMHDTLLLRDVLRRVDASTQALMWAHAAGWTFPEIAKTTGRSAASVRQAHARALRSVRARSQG